MDIAGIQRAMLSEYGLRIDPAMGEYVLENLRRPGSGSLLVIGGDARTGVAMRTMIDLSKLPFEEVRNQDSGFRVG